MIKPNASYGVCLKFYLIIRADLNVYGDMESQLFNDGMGVWWGCSYSSWRKKIVFDVIFVCFNANLGIKPYI